MFGSIKLRTVILQRGLADRSAAVTKECLKLLKEDWLVKCCNGDPIELLKFLDVETYESVGESVMTALLNAELVKVQDSQSIRQLIVLSASKNQGLYLLCQFFLALSYAVAYYGFLAIIFTILYLS